MTGVASDEARAGRPTAQAPAGLGDTATIANAWLPIATAPKDGTAIILGSPEQEYQGRPVEPRSTVGHWLTEEECRERIGDCGGECRCPEYEYHDPYWMSYDGGFTEENPPTHWQPLPVPPAQGIAAPTGGKTGTGLTVGKSPTPQGDAPETPLSTPLPSGSIER